VDTAEEFEQHMRTSHPSMLRKLARRVETTYRKHNEFLAPAIALLRPS
jgi:hypothetical protein